MSAGATIMARLGLDTKGFSDGMAKAAGDANSFGNKLTGGLGRASESSERLLMSSHRVARQVQNLSKDLVSGASGADIFSAGLEGLERSLRLPLGALAGLGVGAVLIGQAAKTREEYQKLNDEINGLLAPAGSLGAGAGPLAPLEEQIKRINVEMSKLKREQASATGGSGLWGKIKQYGQDFWTALAQFDDTRPDDIGKKRDQQISQLDATGYGKAQSAADEYSRKITLKGETGFMGDAERAKADNDDKRKKFLTPGSPDENQLMWKPLEEELNGLLKDIANHISNLRRERVQATLGEIAGRDTKLSNGLSIQSWDEGNRAREAQHEMELAKQARETIGGEAGLEQAQIHMNRADEIKKGIVSLKDSDKDLKGEFTGALDSSTVLQGIKAGVDKLSFANQ